MPMLRRPDDRRRDVRTRRPFVQPDKDRHLMIEIPLPLLSHRRLFSPLAYRQSGRALLKGAMQSPNQPQRQAKTDFGSGHRPAMPPPNPPQARSAFASRLRRRQTAILKPP